MQLVTFASATAAIIATASARSAVALNKECKLDQPHARIVNRCSYPVNLWSVFKGDGCPDSEMVTLNPGQSYAENYAVTDTGVGVSIKISKTQQCKGNDITQLEYYLETKKKDFNYNYLDVSYVDCVSDCPTKKEGYYLQAGNQTGAATASAGNTWCPILSCSDAASCAKMSYINPDDVQTKTCDLESSMTFYMCGSEAPSGDYSSGPAPSSDKPSSPAQKPSSANNKPAGSSPGYKPNNAAVTPAPEVKAANKPHKVKTVVVTATATQYVNVKRHPHAHAHAHAHRHQAFYA